MLTIFFDIEGIVYKEFILAGQTVNSHTTMSFYGDCVKMCEDFAPNFGDKKLAVGPLPLDQGIFDRKQHDCCPPPPYFPLFLRLNKKTESPSF
jgi:hypothetical protein